MMTFPCLRFWQISAAFFPLFLAGFATAQTPAKLDPPLRTTSVPLPGTTKLERMEENLRSVDLEFTPEEWRDFNHAVSKIKLQGHRYPTDQEKQVGH
jgi:hypothetical protein